MTELASDVDPRAEKGSQKIAAFAEIMNLTEESRGSLELKYQLAGWILGGHVFDKGANPYQDFAHLVAVRNALVHMKLVDRIKLGRMEIPGVIQRLPEKVLKDVPLDVNTTWLDRIGTAAMAEWACKFGVSDGSNHAPVCPGRELQVLSRAPPAPAKEKT